MATIPEKKPVYKKWWFWVIVVILLIALISAVSGGSDEDDVTASDTIQTTASESNSAYSMDDLVVKQDENGTWVAYAGDTVASDYTGLAKNDLGIWFVSNGKVDFTKNGTLTVGDTLYTIASGKVTEQAEVKNGTTKKVEKTQFTVGETFSQSGKEIKFVSANPNFTNYNPYATIPSGYKVLEVVFDFANNGDTDFYYSSGDLDCYADNEKCDDFYSVNGHSSFLDTLSPGRTASGQKTYFLIPENATSIVLEYETNWWTENKVEFIVE